MFTVLFKYVFQISLGKYEYQIAVDESYDETVSV